MWITCPTSMTLISNLRMSRMPKAVLDPRDSIARQKIANSLDFRRLQQRARTHSRRNRRWDQLRKDPIPPRCPSYRKVPRFHPDVLWRKLPPVKRSQLDDQSMQQRIRLASRQRQSQLSRAPLPVQLVLSCRLLNLLVSPKLFLVLLALESSSIERPQRLLRRLPLLDPSSQANLNRVL